MTLPDNTISYVKKIPYSGNRPYADVQLLNNSGGRGPTIKCLVDTGADYLQINVADANAVGLSLVGATSKTVSTVAGTAKLMLVSKVDVFIENSSLLTVDVLVDTTNSTKPQLAGRQLFLTAFDAGFGVSDWLRT